MSATNSPLETSVTPNIPSRKSLVIDNHPFIRNSVKSILLQENFTVVGETGCGSSGVQMAVEHEPDLIILDLTLLSPGIDGLEVITRLRKMHISSLMLVLTSRCPVAYAMRCMRAGANGYIAKTVDEAEMRKAIDALISGYTYFPNIRALTWNQTDLEMTEQMLIRELSHHELLVLEQLCRGLGNKETGKVLRLSDRAVSAHKTSLQEKLNIKSVVSLADFAKRNNLL